MKDYKDIQQILQADFSDDPQRIQAFQIPMEDDRERLSLPEQTPMLDAESASTENTGLDDRKSRFMDLLSQFKSQNQIKPNLEKAQTELQDLQKLQTDLNKPDDLQLAREERDKMRRMALLMSGLDDINKAGARYAGVKLDPDRELSKYYNQQGDQAVADVIQDQKMQQQQEDRSMGKEKHEVIMDKLRSPQSRMVQDYFIEMNQAMGRNVNEETVRQQPAESLYKISPWMQNIYATKLRNDMQQQRMEMDKRRLSNEDERLRQGQARLDLLTGKEGRLTEQFDKKYEDTQQEQSAKVVDKFEKDKVVQKANESIAQADNVIQLVQSDNPIGHSAIPTFMARASGEVGNLSEADKAPFGGSQALSARIQQVTQQYKDGKLTPENQAFVTELAQTMKKSAKRNKAGRAMDLRSKYSKSYNMDMKEVNDLMMPELNKLDEEDQQAVEWALKNPTSPKAQQILEMHGY